MDADNLGPRDEVPRHCVTGSIPVSRTTFDVHKQAIQSGFAPHMHHNVTAGQGSAQYQ